MYAVYGTGYCVLQSNLQLLATLYVQQYFCSTCGYQNVEMCIRISGNQHSEMYNMIYGENGQHCKDSKMTTCDSDIMTHNNGHKETTNGPHRY